MGKEKYYQYFVEGEDEKKLVDVLKSDMKLIVSGKSQVFNVTQQKLTRLRVMNLKPGTTVVLIFDADAGNLQILKDNINFLHKEKVVSEVIDIIIFMLSSDFLDSYYCYDIEMKKAIEREKRGECKIIPVIVRACMWDETPLKNFLAFPKDGKSIEQYERKDDAYLEIAKGVREIVQSME